MPPLQELHVIQVSVSSEMSPHNDCSVESDLAGAVAKLAMVHRSSSTDSSGSDVPAPPVHVTIEPSPSPDESEPEHGDGFESESTMYFDAHSDTDLNQKGDSGVEVDHEPDFVAPEEEKIKKIVEMVEFYFSDAYILKDAFLLKHVRRHKEGFISLKLISSFKKVKHETRDWRQVAFACRRSEKLEVNESGTKVRRLAPLPDIDQTTPSRTVVVIGLPSEKASIEGVAELFSHFGQIASIRVLRPGTTVPTEARSVASRNPEMATQISALIEFECTESARRCSLEMNAAGKIKVVEIAKREPRKTNKTSNNKKSQESTPSGSRPESPNVQTVHSDTRTRTDRRKRRGAATYLRSDNSGSGLDTPISSSDAEISPCLQRRQLQVSNSQNSTPSGSPFMKRSNMIRNKDQNRSPLASSPEIPRHIRGSISESSSPSRSPWVRRRLAAADDSLGRRSPQGFSLSVPTNVFRYPLGPDGTTGFHDPARRGRFVATGEYVVAM